MKPYEGCSHETCDVATGGIFAVWWNKSLSDQAAWQLKAEELVVTLSNFRLDLTQNFHLTAYRFTVQVYSIGVQYSLVILSNFRLDLTQNFHLTVKPKTF